MQRLTRLPLTLFRIQPQLPVALRDYDTQMALKRSSFDLKTHDGLVLPEKGDVFRVPNGMSLRPAGVTMANILTGFRGEPTIYRFQANMEIPADLALYHEHTDHYSLQTGVPISLEELNQRLTEILRSLPTQTREEWLAEWNDPDYQDN